MNQQTPIPQLSHDQLQAQCFQWFHNNFPQQRKLLHANNNNSRNAIEGNQKKALGIIVGVFDLEYFYAGKLYFFDIKTGTGTLSKEQKAFQLTVEAQGAKCYEIRSLEQFQTIIREIND